GAERVPARPDADLRSAAGDWRRGGFRGADRGGLALAQPLDARRVSARGNGLKKLRGAPAQLQARLRTPASGATLPGGVPLRARVHPPLPPAPPTPPPPPPLPPPPRLPL